MTAENGLLPKFCQGQFTSGLGRSALGIFPCMADKGFGATVVEAIQARGWTMRDAARISGVSYDVIRELHRRPGSSTSAENAEKLMRVLDLSKPAPLAPEREAPIGDLVPIYNVTVSAGHGAVLAEHEEEADRLLFPPGYLRRITSTHAGKLAILNVKGDSMSPTLNDGDIVMVDVTKRDLSFDGLFVLRDGGESLLVKRIGRGARRGEVKVISDNRFYPATDRSVTDIEVVGRVIWIGARV